MNAVMTFFMPFAAAPATGIAGLPFTISPEFAELATVKAIEVTLVIIACIAGTMLVRRAAWILGTKANLSLLATKSLQAFIKWCGVLLAAALILSVFNVPILTILSTMLAMVAIGFVAVWSVLSHFLCTVLLILFKPFSVGDILEFPSEDIKGKVVDLTAIFTVLKCEDGSLYQIPNNLIFQKPYKRFPAECPIGLDVQLGEKEPVE